MASAVLRLRRAPVGPPGQPRSLRFSGFPPDLALVQAVTVTVHLQNLYVVGKTVQQGTSQTFGYEYLSQLVEGEDCWSAARAGNICFAHPVLRPSRRRAPDEAGGG